MQIKEMYELVCCYSVIYFWILVCIVIVMNQSAQERLYGESVEFTVKVLEAFLFFMAYICLHNIFP